VNNEDILQTARDWVNAGKRVAIATVIETWGSSPRPRGSQLVIDDTGAFTGSVSGGCVETAVIAEARDVLRSGRPRILEYGVTDDRAWEVGLACGGRIRIYVEPLVVK
jgi:xanthine/CO dehydrogenase XdhC/CoxF family maturation factor